MAKANLVYINMETGEVFDDYKKAHKQFVEEYDGGDDTNCVDFWDIFELGSVARG